MKTYNIIFFIILQSFISVIFSQEIRDGFEVYPRENVTSFEDLNFNKYSTHPLDKNGRATEVVNFDFYSIAKLKEIVLEQYCTEKQKRMGEDYTPVVVLLVRASDGEIVAVSFNFYDLQDPSLIDTKKLQAMRRKMMDELSFENLLFRGDKAVSGCMTWHAFLFRL